jgi:hypothetical protein
MKKLSVVFLVCVIALAVTLATPEAATADVKNRATMLFFGHGSPNSNSEILVEVWVWDPVGEFWTRFWGVQRLNTPWNTGPLYSRLYKGYTYLLANPSYPTPYSLSGRLSTANKSFPSQDVIEWENYGVQYTHIGNIDQTNYLHGPVSEGCEVLWRDGGQTLRWQSLMELFKAAGVKTVRGYWFWDGGGAMNMGTINWDRIWERFIKLPKPSNPLSGEPGSNSTGGGNGFYDSPIYPETYNWWDPIPPLPDPSPFPDDPVIADLIY